VPCKITQKFGLQKKERREERRKEKGKGSIDLMGLT